MSSSPRWAWERQLPGVPSKPGVYSFLSGVGEILYVGKAINLHRRIGSYRGRLSDPKTRSMISQAKKLAWLEVESDLEAVLTEAELIRAHHPKYNFRLRDDKSPLYIIFTEEPYPRVLTARRKELPHLGSVRREFGPYPSAYQARKVLHLVRQAFPFCNATPRQKQQKRACFYYHIGLCPGACAGTINPDAYASILDGLRMFLMGKRRDIVRKLQKAMQDAADRKDFEEAARLRDQLAAIRAITETRQFRFWLQPKAHTVQSRHQARTGLWKTLSPFLRMAKRDVPSEPFSRIEAYDVANLMGKEATASMVVFTDGLPEPSEYRRFRIRSTNEPDDPAMLSEAILRRIRHREWKLPDLMVIDGGKPQVLAAKRALATAGLHHRIPVLGIAKSQELLVIHVHAFHVMQLPKDSPALQLVMHLRDEAHRYARSYHHLLRDKSLTGTKSLGNNG